MNFSCICIRIMYFYLFLQNVNEYSFKLFCELIYFNNKNIYEEILKYQLNIENVFKGRFKNTKIKLYCHTKNL